MVIIQLEIASIPFQVYHTVSLDIYFTCAELPMRFMICWIADAKHLELIYWCLFLVYYRHTHREQNTIRKAPPIAKKTKKKKILRCHYSPNCLPKKWCNSCTHKLFYTCWASARYLLTAAHTNHNHHHHHHTINTDKKKHI